MLKAKGITTRPASICPEGLRVRVSHSCVCVEGVQEFSGKTDYGAPVVNPPEGLFPKTHFHHGEKDL